MPSTNRTAILLHFAEQVDELLPSDAAGGLKDMAGDSGSTPALGLPSVVSSLLGYGREFTADSGLQASEDVANQTRLTRNCTIEVLVEYDIASASGDSTIIARGVQGSAAERILFCLVIQKLSATTAVVKMRWQEADGTEAVVAGKAIVVPSSGYLYIWASRRWISDAECEVKYGVNEQYLGDETVVEGDIGNGDDGTTTVGCVGDGSGDYEDFFFGIIDSIRVSTEVRSPEECRQVFREIAIYQPRGYDAVKALLPAGDAYSMDVDSAIQRELMVEGDALGQVMAKGEELREDYAPMTTWSMLEDWERICQLPPKAIDSISVRRARILSYLRKTHGYSPAQIQDALSEVLDLVAASIEILEYENLYEDSFTTSVADYWIGIAPAGSLSIVSDALRVQVDNTGDNRWANLNDTLGPTHLRMTLDGDVRDSDPTDGIDMTVKLVTYPTTFNGLHLGIAAWNAITRDLIWLGYYRTGGAWQLGWRTYTDYALNAFQSLENPAPALPQWLRLRFDGSDNWTAYYNATGPDDTSNETAIGSGIELPTHVGIMAMTDIASNPSAGDSTFDDWRLYVPNGLRVFNWYAYRDPVLSGTADLDGGRRIVAKLKPAHTSASAIGEHPIECDDSYSFCDDGPLG